MNWKVSILVIAGAALALGAGAGSLHYLRRMEAEVAGLRANLAALGDMRAVPVPARDLTRGEALTAADFTTLSLPARSVPANVVADLPAAPAGTDGGTDGAAPAMVALTDLQAGTLVPATALALGPAEAGAALLLSSDGRAVAVAPRNLADMQGLIRTGDMVDLFWTRDVGGGTTETRLIGPALTVIALPATPVPAEPATAPAEGAAAGTAAEPALAAPEGRLLLAGLAEDVALILQAEARGSFDLALAGGPLPEGMTEVVVGPGDLADLPLAVRAGEAPANPGPDRFLPLPVQQKTCALAVVRQAERQIIEVPC
ncbi:RcpC/CpaB family pilus assembly protein [Frigidibacter oleivorans]|uniref:RcpC/CpaB family pilus assembly protein n=1 Tax=Frigidibacter oleivorans TaxID=2487129 RepID=UPI000F8D7402|nr:RcpC/CpaB family pilus assembly protein [Frigidibacter oleivorans]